MHKPIWKLAWPIMLSNISVPLLGLVDTAILGHLDDHSHLAAVAMGASLLTFVLWSFGFLRMGTTALIAHSSGQYESQPTALQYQLSGITHSALGLAACLGAIIYLCSQPLVAWAVEMVAAVDSVTPLAQTFLEIRFFAAPATLMNYVLLGYFIGLGQTKVPLYLLVSSNLANAILDYIMVYHFDLGSAGVAYATNIVEYSQLLVALIIVRPYLAIRIPLSDLKKHWPKLFRLNADLFLRTFLLLLTFAFFMTQGARHSAALLAANSILLNLLMFISNALDGFAVAAESLVGKAFGQKDRAKIWQVVKVSGQWSAGTAVLFSLVLLLFHDGILHLLTSQEDVLTLLAELEWWLIALPLVGFASYWLDGIFIGLGNGRAMRNSLIVATFFCFLPLWWGFQSWSYHGLWLALYGFLCMRAIWLLFKLKSALHNVVH